MVQNLEMTCVQSENPFYCSEGCSVPVGWKLLATLQRSFWNYQLPNLL